MSYAVTIPGFEGQSIEVQAAGFFSRAKLLINGQPAPRGAKRGEMLLRRNDGRMVIAKWKSQLIDIPKLSVDGTTFAVAEPLKWYQWAWGGLPILLLLIGGAIGGLVGFIGFTINAKIFRSTLNNLLKYGLTAIITVLALVVYIFLAAFLVGFMRGLMG